MLGFVYGKEKFDVMIITSADYSICKSHNGNSFEKGRVELREVNHVKICEKAQKMKFKWGYTKGLNNVLAV